MHGVKSMVQENLGCVQLPFASLKAVNVRAK